MTTDEKAKAYEMALEAARKELGVDRKEREVVQQVLHNIFPEIRESEDERIRRVLVVLVQEAKGQGRTSFYGESIDDILAYLEKQKEHLNKSFEDVWRSEECTEILDEGVTLTPRFKEKFKEVCEAFYEAGENHFRDDTKMMEKPNIEIIKFVYNKSDEEFIRDCANILKGNDYGTNAERLLSMLEQKPAEWSEDWREEDIQTRFAFYTYKDDLGVLYLSNVFVEEASRNHGFGTRILRAAEKVAETIGAITISLKVKQDSPANAWYRKNGYGYVCFEDGYDWLEKNLEYLKPNKEVEWSEKCPHYSEGYGCEISPMKKCESCEKRPRWKPSEEQMIALDGCLEHWNGNKSQKEILESLYEQLKTL